MERLTIFRHKGGDDAVRMVKEIDEELAPVARELGAIAHIVARDGDDVVAINLWSSPEASDAMARDPRTLEVLRRHGFEGPPPDRQHFEVVYTMFAEERAPATR